MSSELIALVEAYGWQATILLLFAASIFLSSRAVSIARNRESKSKAENAAIDAQMQALYIERAEDDRKRIERMERDHDELSQRISELHRLYMLSQEATQEANAHANRERQRANEIMLKQAERVDTIRDKYQARVDGYSQENKSLKMKIAALQEQIDGHRDEIDGLKKQIATLIEAHESEKQLRKQAESEAEHARNERDVANEEISRLTKKIADLENEIKQLKKGDMKDVA